MNAKDIIELYSYSESEQENFCYLHEYMNLIKDEIPEIEKDKEKLRKFALAGLFLTYRAFNHWGDSMTTEVDESKYIENSSHIKKVKIYKEYFGETINSTSHYLSKINFSVFNILLITLRIKKLSKQLCNFVIK